MERNIGVCMWRISPNSETPYSPSCKACEGTRDYAITNKCLTCLFQNPDGKNVGYSDLICKTKELVRMEN